MKAFLVGLALLTFAVLVVMAVVFRSKAAGDMLRLGRNILYAWVALVVVLAIFEFRRRGL